MYSSGYFLFGSILDGCVFDRLLPVVKMGEIEAAEM